MGMRAPRASSIVDVFSLQPSLVSVAGSVAPEDCHLALVAARALLAAIREDAQNDNTLATIPDELTGVETAVRWPGWFCRLPSLVSAAGSVAPDSLPPRSRGCTSATRSDAWGRTK